MYTQKTVEEMTHEELLNYAKELEASAEDIVVSTGRIDLAYVLSGMLQLSLSDIASGKTELTEDDISPYLLEVAHNGLRWNFSFDNETEQISSFLSALPIDWQSLHNLHSRKTNDK